MGSIVVGEEEVERMLQDAAWHKDMQISLIRGVPPNVR